MNDFFQNNYLQNILFRTGEHLVLVFVSITIAVLIGIPLGILITRKPKLAQYILGFANIIQTIPSLAIFGFLISLPFIGGIGKVPAIIALTLYALLPLIRNTYVGITNIDPAIREAGVGMGMTDRQLLLQVEIPLALDVILAGVRVATVICVGIATIAAAIGAGGLGIFIFRGIATVNNQLILTGAIPAALIALTADLGIGWLEKIWKQRDKKHNLLSLKSISIVGIILLILFGLLAIAQKQTLLNYNQVIIGSKNFTEQVILGEIMAQQIEAHTDLKVDRRFNLGGTFICHEAVKAGKIDGYVEYTGTSFIAILKEKPITDANKVYQLVKQEYEQKFNLDVLKPLGFENTFAMIIRGKEAKRLDITNLSEAAQYTPQWKAGFGYEFMNRKDGFPGLAKVYGIKFAQPPQDMEIGLIYQALAEKKIDFGAGNSTDGLIPVLDLYILKDNKRYFPPYEAVPVFNQNSLDKHPQVKEIILQLAGKISAEEMQKVNNPPLKRPLETQLKLTRLST